MTGERCIWVSLPHATFGIISRGGIITETAPIARWAAGKAEQTVITYFRKRNAVIRVLT